MLTLEQKIIIKELREKDNSYGTIAKILECDDMAVKRWCRKNQLGGIRNTGQRNENILHKKDGYMVATDTKGREFYFDEEDMDKILDYYWYINSGGYVETFRNHKTILLHRYLMQPLDSEEVDHINHKTNDCRRKNMRVCTHKQNSRNQSPQRNSACKYKGVDYNLGKYRARIKHNGKTIDLGRYDSEIDAGEAYRKASRLYHKEFGYAE